MRGSPIREVLLFALLWGALLLPLRAITRREGGMPPPITTAAHPSELQTVWARVRFSEPPGHFVLFADGQPLWEESYPEQDQEQAVQMTWQENITQWHIQAQWEQDGHRAIGVRISPPLGPPLDTVIWQHGERIEEALLFL